jgi:chromosome segregation ATPase
MRHLTASQKIAQLEHRIAHLEKMGFLTPRAKKDLQSALSTAKKSGYGDFVSDISYLLKAKSPDDFHSVWYDAFHRLDGHKASLYREMDYLESEVVSEIDKTVQKLNVRIQKAQKKIQELSKKKMESEKRMAEIEKELEPLEEIYTHLQSFD